MQHPTCRWKHSVCSIQDRKYIRHSVYATVTGRTADKRVQYLSDQRRKDINGWGHIQECGLPRTQHSPGHQVICELHLVTGDVIAYTALEVTKLLIVFR